MLLVIFFFNVIYFSRLDYESVKDKFDQIDHVFDMHGHIIGMCLSPDQRLGSYSIHGKRFYPITAYRYLYVNTRPWPTNYTIESPLDPPVIAQEIDIHVIDLVNLREVGSLLRSHKAFTPNAECFFIFLDVSKNYVSR